MRQEQESSRARMEGVQEFRLYLAGLTELKQHFALLRRDLSGSLTFGEELCFDQWLVKLYENKATPNEILQKVTASQLLFSFDVGVTSSRAGIPGDVANLSHVGMMEACYLAAFDSSETEVLPEKAESIDGTGIVLATVVDDFDDTPSGFSVVCVCMTNSQVRAAERILESNGLSALVTRDESVRIDSETSDEYVVQRWIVLVLDEEVAVAHKHLSRWLDSLDTDWNCDQCNTPMPRGYQICQGCGKSKSAAVLTSAAGTK